MKIILAGGGSGGSVSPLLAVAGEINKLRPKSKFLLIGTDFGPERGMAKNAGIPFVAIKAGKFRRYFSILNLIEPFKVVLGFLKSFKLLRKIKPDCIFGAGSFVQVPVVWAAALLKIPVILHQQDVLPSLANKMCQIFAKKITVTFEDSITDFPTDLGIIYSKKPAKTVLVGNPFRQNLKNFTKQQADVFFKLSADLPTLLVLGGGTGAAGINKVVYESLPSLTKTVQIIHSTGQNKFLNQKYLNYRAFEFIDNMGAAYAAADFVLCRAGLSTITELSNLAKMAIIVPMPDSHQELNAYLLYRHKAAIVVDQKILSAKLLVQIIRRILFEHNLQQELKKNISKIMPKNSAKKIAELIIKTIENNGS